MLSLDEQVEQIMRNAASVGIDLSGHMKSGLIRVEYEPPQEMEVDVHFHHIEELVKEFKPKRVVIDSLSTYGSNLGGERQAAIMIATALGGQRQVLRGESLSNQLV